MAHDPHHGLAMDTLTTAVDRPVRRFWPPLLLVVAICLVFYMPALQWGLPATVSWSQDTIAGVRTLGPVEQWPEKWIGRYPPLHYLILRAAYEPILQHWDATRQRTVDPATGVISILPPHAPKIGLLILLARIVTVLFAAAGGVGIWMAARAFGLDSWGATLATSALMTSAAYTYFAHLGNVDVPSICWFAWSMYFYARLLDTGRLRHALLLGLFGALACSTKDALAGMYPGMAVVLLFCESKKRAGTHSLWSSLPAVALQWKWLAGIAAFILPYAFLYGIWHDPSAYVARMKYWLDPPAHTLHAQQLRYDGQIELIWACIRYGAGAVGWPMLVAMFAAAIYALRRRRSTALALLLPIVGYYLVVIVSIRFVYSRFLFAPLAAGGLLLGLALSDLARRLPRSTGVRFTLTAGVFLPTVMYAWSMNAEMLTDSRYRAEAWFRQNVPLSATVGAFSNPQYLPRFQDMGYATFHVTMTRESFDRPQPDYLILTSYNYEDFDDDERSVMRDLTGETLGYTRVTEFDGRFLGTARSLIGIAGWGAPVPGKISPTLVVLRRGESSHHGVK